MQNCNKSGAVICGIFAVISMAVLGYFIVSATTSFKEYDRTVMAKGLSEREYEADVIIWPIKFNESGNDIREVYKALEETSRKISNFLNARGVKGSEISLSLPSINDRLAQGYAKNNIRFRFAASQVATIYSNDIDKVRKAVGELPELGKEGVIFGDAGYQQQPRYIFTRLNQVKPEMIEESTKNARTTAEKFAEDSKSRLGKIKNARQGQFSIYPRDDNNPHIKKVRVVSTVEYYLVD